MKKLGILFVMVVGVLVVILWAFFHFSKKRQDINLVVIPHFMIDSGKVSEFYELTKQEYFGENTLPDRIILISPNHFFFKTNENGRFM